MTRITLDSNLRMRLNDLKEPLELCDDSGRVLARVFPVADIPEYELTEPGLDVEDLRRRELSTDLRYTTAEVLEHLENL